MKQIAFFCLILFPCIVLGQVSPAYNIYYKNKHFYNPAEGIADSNYQYHVSVYAKNKFVKNDVWTKPLNFSFNHIGNIRRISSFYSVGYQYDGYSFFDRHSLYAGFGYQWKLPGTNQLNFGIKAVLNFDRLHLDRLFYFTQYKTKKLYFTPDLDMGISYRVKGFCLGFAVKNIIGNYIKIEGEKLIQNQREWVAHIAYDFDIKQKVIIAPFAQMLYERKLGIDIGVSASLFRWVELCYMFRALELRHVYVVTTKLYKGLYIGTAVDHSHIHRDINLDIVLGFNFK